MKVLVCEDDYMMNKAIEHRLKRDGYDVVIADDGKKAAEFIRTEEFDMIISDVLMPFITGIEIINLVRNELKKTTPIIILSKLGNESTILEAFNLGADDYLTKPFSPNELTMRVKKLLMRR